MELGGPQRIAARDEAVRLLEGMRFLAGLQRNCAGFAEEADAILARHPDDPAVLRAAGALHAALGAKARAQALYARVLECPAESYESEIEIARAEWGLGRRAEAEERLRRRMEARPERFEAFRWAGAHALEQGLYVEALALIRQAYERAPTEPDVVEAYAHILTAHALRGEAAEVYARFLAEPTANAHHLGQYLTLLTDLGRHEDVLAAEERVAGQGLAGQGGRFARQPYFTGHARLARAYDRAAVVARAREREASPDWLSTEAVRDLIARRIRERRPFSLIRLGDGEARFLAYLDPAIARLMREDEVYATAHSIWEIWFDKWPLGEAPRQRLLELNDALVTAIGGADILGVPTADRLAIDNRAYGFLAYLDDRIGQARAQGPAAGRGPGGVLRDLVARLRGRVSARPSSCPSWTDAIVSIHLNEVSPFYREVLAGCRSLSVIGPHPGLCERLCAHLDVPMGAEHLIPGETLLPERYWRLGGTRHFPEHYDALIAGLRVPEPGAVFLIAGGLLGKIYCDVVRRRGGIAIDIGSVADAWTGFSTRPGHFLDASRWRLPEP